jgi:hypothetical protein
MQRRREIMVIAKCVLVRVVVAFSLLGSVYSATAGMVAEIDDVGDMMASAYLLPGGTDKVQGTLNYDADLYKFYWNGGAFYANTINYALPFNAQKDCELFLFDSAGYGIAASNGAWTGLNMPAASAYVYTTLTPGYYYLGVTIDNLEPCFDYYGYLEYTIFGYIPYYSPTPKDPDYDAGPLAVWGNYEQQSSDSGSYVINFAEASLFTAAAGPSHPTGDVPEPATMALLGLGAMALLRRRS